QILAFGSIEEWKQKRDEYPPLSAILLNVGCKKIDEPAISEQIRNLQIRLLGSHALRQALTIEFTIIENDKRMRLSCRQGKCVR
ncbi:hypothetical protein ACC763_40080, partial [Rhizobium ruizarguesonis]